MKYPKIETLYNRDKKTFKVIPSELRLPEFGMVNTWLVTEKIHGTNIRVMMDQSGEVSFGGRTDNAQIPLTLVQYLMKTFTVEKLQSVFRVQDDGLYPEITAFGEGYGEKVQRGGGGYRKGVSFRLFDVRIGDWWLNWESVVDIANNLGIETVPEIGKLVDFLPTCYDELLQVIDFSEVASLENNKDILPEGIVARTEPLLLMRNGKRLVWKIKFKDFGKEN